MWTAVISALISLAGAYLFATSNLDNLRHIATLVVQDMSKRLNQPIPASADQFLLGAITTSGLSSFLLFLLLGLFIGALGGLIGRRQSTRYTRIYERLSSNLPKGR